jgi:hypothetical protein
LLQIHSSSSSTRTTTYKNGENSFIILCIQTQKNTHNNNNKNFFYHNRTYFNFIFFTKTYYIIYWMAWLVSSSSKNKNIWTMFRCFCISILEMKPIVALCWNSPLRWQRHWNKCHLSRFYILCFLLQDIMLPLWSFHLKYSEKRRFYPHNIVDLLIVLLE